MKIFITIWLMASLTSCALIPEISFLGEEIESELIQDIKISRETIKEHNKDK